MAEHLLFDYEDLTFVSFTVFSLVSKYSGILQENIVGCTLRYRRLMGLPAMQE